MECRMIARRAEHASMTIVGDLGQADPSQGCRLLARTPGSSRPERRPYARAAHRIPGTTGNRGPRDAVPRPRDRPDALVPGRGHALDPAGRRHRGRGPRGHRRGAARGHDRGHRRRSDHRGAGAVRRPGRDATAASLVKGLEYDHVIVVEPSDIVAAEPRGYSRLLWCSPEPSPVWWCYIASRYPLPCGRLVHNSELRTRRQRAYHKALDHLTRQAGLAV